MLGSELILNADRSIYHLALHPEEIADTIFLVGDQNRVERISRHFDTLEVCKAKREFITHTGTIGDRRFSAISTGIGTDNIDIVVNELDALVNIDLENREVKEEKRSLTLIRLGTSGGFHVSAEIDSAVTTAHALGLDPFPAYYEWNSHPLIWPFPDSEDTPHSFLRSAYLISAREDIRAFFDGFGRSGITLTCMGFYGPQGRQLRLSSKLAPAFPLLQQFTFEGMRILNLEMESAALYFLCHLLGHTAFSISTILANRITGKYSSAPLKAVDDMISGVLDRICA